MGLVESLAFHPPDQAKTAEIFKTRDVSRLREETVTARGNKICMLWFNNNKPLTVLYSHGNAEDIGLSFQALRKLTKRVGVNLLAYDYSGYGMSDGSPSEKNAYADIQAAYDWLISEGGVPAERVIFFGRSLGSGPTTHLASKSEVGAGLVLQSPLSSAIRCVLKDCGGGLLDFMDIFKNRKKIGNVKNFPVLIVHGKQDQVVPFSHGEELYNIINAIPESDADCLWLDRCGHNDIEFLAEIQFYDKLRQFVEKIELKLAAEADEAFN